MRKLGPVFVGCLIAIGMTGCASRPTVVDSTPLWPFEQLTIRTSVGAVHGYLYKPEDAAVRLVVALQSSPCPTGDDRDDEPILNTNGVVWEQFKYDSLFFQFERPGGGGMTDSNSVVVVCERADRTANDWQEAVIDSLQAVRKREHLEGVPTTYLGIGRGAALALNTALNDPESKSIVLMSAALNAPETDAVTQSLPRAKAEEQPSILFLHGGSDNRTSVDEIARVADNLAAQHIPTKLIVFEKVGADFGLGSTETDCFDLVAAKLGEYVRFDQRTSGRKIRLSCRIAESPADIDAPRIERVRRM